MKYIVRFRGQPVRFTYAAGRRVYEIVPRTQASVFSSEAAAWEAACKYEMPYDDIAICGRDVVVEARAAC